MVMDYHSSSGCTSSILLAMDLVLSHVLATTLSYVDELCRFLSVIVLFLDGMTKRCPSFMTFLTVPHNGVCRNACI